MVQQICPQPNTAAVLLQHLVQPNEYQRGAAGRCGNPPPSAATFAIYIQLTIDQLWVQVSATGATQHSHHLPTYSSPSTRHHRRSHLASLLGPCCVATQRHQQSVCMSPGGDDKPQPTRAALTAQPDHAAAQGHLRCSHYQTTRQS